MLVYKIATHGLLLQILNALRVCLKTKQRRGISESCVEVYSASGVRQGGMGLGPDVDTVLGRRSSYVITKERKKSKFLYRVYK